jgi:ATP-dependent Clp protease ATP-binding subunit ClpC
VEVETMASDIPPGIPISPTLASLARRFDIDLSGLADEALTERILRDPMSALTPRMRSSLLAAQKLGRELGHKHIGAEHVFLAILLDDHSLPSQIMQSVGTRNEVVEKIRTMLASESYNRPGTS